MTLLIAIGTVPHHAHCFSDRETNEIFFAGIERRPLPACRLDHQDRLTRAAKNDVNKTGRSSPALFE
jgi:hypothetical protein